MDFLIFFFFLFGCGCGDLKRRDFRDWLFGCGFDVEFGACFKKWGLRGESGPSKKNPLNNRAGSKSRV